MMTKEQERKHLAKIATLIAEAGPDSYIGKTFAGVAEMAAENIEHDSWIGPLVERDAALECEAELRAHISRLAKEIIASRREVTDLEARIKELESTNLLISTERDELRDQVKAERAKQLPADLYKRLWLLVDEKSRAAITRMDELTETLADLAGAPQDIAVAAALKNLAKAKKERDEALSLLQELDKYEPANC